MVNIPISREIRLGDGKIGVLMLHGFTGSPESIKPWAESLAANGYRVHVPLLPGHGTSWQELNTKRWPEIYQAAENAFLDMQSRCERVFVAGFSVGGALALRLAQLHGSKIEGLLLCNPALFDDRPISRILKIAKHFISSTHAGPSDVHRENVPRTSYTRIPLKAWDSIKDLMADVRENLFMVDLPLMVAHSTQDHVIHPESSEFIIDNVYSVDIREIIFENSYHNVSLDYDSDSLNEESVEFIHDVLSGEIARGDGADERDLIDAEFDAIVSGLNLDTSTESTLLDEITGFREPNPRNVKLQRATKFGIASILASAAYMLMEGITGSDPLGLGGWAPALLFAGGIASLIYRTARRFDDGDDGAKL